MPKSTFPFTTESVANAPAPRPAHDTQGRARQVLYWDADGSGFGLRVTGSTRAFFVRRRVAGRSVFVTLKPGFPKLAVNKARVQAYAMYEEMGKGVDPIK